MATFEHPVNGHRESTGLLDVIGALVLGPLWYVGRGLVVGGLVYFALALLPALFIGLFAVPWLVILWLVFGIGAPAAIGHGYLRKGWRRVAVLAVLVLAGAQSGTGIREAFAGDPPPVLRGEAVVLDGDTLWLGSPGAADDGQGGGQGRGQGTGQGAEIRLWGVSAAEWNHWPTGAYMRAVFDGIAHRRELACTPVGREKTHGRTVAICRRADGVDVVAALLRLGGATVYRRWGYFDPDKVRRTAELRALAIEYDQAEAAARAACRGLWAAWCRDWKPTE